MSWKIEYAILILVSTIVDYFASIQMSRTDTPWVRKGLLSFSLLINLGFLFVFKYYNFSAQSAQALIAQFNIFYDIPQLDILLPVGISFYTFQTLSYTVDVYKKEIEPEKHFGVFALYVSFWPQLVAGPIERASRLLPQFYLKHEFEYERVKSGLIRMSWGFAKKLVIADRLALYVNTVFNNPDRYEGWPVLIAIYFFAFQIYCDFSGYSDIAIGVSRIMGFDLMENFKTPYFAKSVGEFWQRWHISLSTWFRDYVYIPLGGNQVSYARWALNISATFLISGLWHGANWTFVIWGGLHGFYLLTERAIQNISGNGDWRKYPVISNLKILFTFHLVLFGWIFFRANDLGDVTTIISQAFTNIAQARPPTSFTSIDFYLAIFLIFLLLIQEKWFHTSTFEVKVAKLPLLGRWAYYVAIVITIFWFGVFNNSEFIYFQF